MLQFVGALDDVLDQVIYGETGQDTKYGKY